MYAVYRQAHSPTAVEFSVYCNFISSQEKNLVVAGTSQLYVYRIIHDVETRKEKLEQVASFSLFGNIMSMASVQLVGANRDALLLSFKDAKDGFVQNVHIPIVRVDPENRCAVMLVYGTKLVLDEKLLNIVDMKRVAVRQDTCSIVAISLNIMQKVHPVIWSLTNLPFDCTQVMAVPKPIGGVVVFAVNSLLYLNQSVPPFGVSLNSQTTGTTAFPLRVQEGVKISLDCSQSAFIGHDKMVISLKGGEIYVLTLITDGMRSVRAFHFDKAAASVLTTCMMTMEPGYLFLGSRLGNSLLLKYTEKLQEPPDEEGRLDKDTRDKDKPEEPPNKKKRVESSANWTDEVDEIEVYGSEAQSGTQLATYSFEVCDSILNIGPCANASMGEPAFLSEEFQSNPEPDLEVVVCSGYGKNGALSVLQRSIRPQVVTTFELPGCHDMWTVISNESKDDKKERSSHRTREEEEEEEGEEEEREEKEKKERAGKEEKERNEEEKKKEEEEEGDGAKEGCQRGRQKKHGFLILSREDSTMILQTGQEIMELDTSGFATQGPTVFAGNIGDNKYIIQLHFIPVDLGSPIVHCSVADPHVVIMTADGAVTMFVLKSDSYLGKTHRLALQKPHISTQSRVISLCAYRDVSGMFTTENKVSCPVRDDTAGCSQSDHSVDDEEEMLYGDCNAAANRDDPNRGSSASMPPGSEGSLGKSEPTHWCMIVRENGVMEIYQLPDWRLVFLVKNFPVGQRVLVDSSSGQSATQGEGKKEEVTRQGEIPLVKEVTLVHVDQDLLIYEAFPYDQQQAQNLKVRFKKMPHNINFREKRSKVRKERRAEGGEDGVAIKSRVARFRYFEDISGYSGVFICGPSPHWMLGELRISVLPTYLSYDAPWPVYAVCTSVKELCTRIPRMTGEEKEFETIDRDDRYINPQQEKFSIQLISPVSWETIPNTRIDLEEWEHVTCMKTVALKSQETVSGLKGYIAAGTCLMQGEEVTCRGRILILDIIEVVPEPGQPLTKNKFKVLYEKEQKGPVTALCHCSGFLVSAIGQKIFLWSLKDNDLTGMAFIDTQLHIHQMFSIKNFILAADLMKSVSLLRYQPESKTLSLVSRDAKPLEVYSIEFMVDNNQLGFLVSDRDKNLSVYMYLPEAKESFGGMRLLRRADFNAGANVNTFWRMPCRGALDTPRWTEAWEKTYRRLLMLQNALNTMLPHHAGLNPKAFRMLHSDRRTLQNAVRNVLDGELLNKYLYLSTMERSELAKKIGTTQDIRTHSHGRIVPPAI
ncbi:hypothetical protein CRUP_007797 [Coryphaenoides rupestris]|nr:hypothetical protein CRUP_007797 [Coryphaenoides rupestris]